MELSEFAEGVHIANIDLLLTNKFIEIVNKYAIRAIYIAPPDRYGSYASILFNNGFQNVYPFLGGFMEGSIVLFCLGTHKEKEYFTRITGLSL